jgi:hypothetical protein
MKSNFIRVIAAIVDEKELTLYKEDGETVGIQQGDPRLASILRIITPILSEGAGSVAEVDIGDGDYANPYQQYEEKAQGKVSFFKVAKSRLAGWLSKAADALAEKQAPIVLGAVPNLPAPLLPVVPLVQTKAEKLLSVAEEIIAHATPVSAPEFHDKDVGAKGDQTIVAIMGDKVVTGVEALKPQFRRAVTHSGKGLEVFLQRCGVVAQRRQHSVEDLLKFLEKGDLPIAEDGTIIIYKVLRRAQDGDAKSKTHYLDCHTSKVRQQVGSYVCMDERLVDPNRRNECSNGLHVARRAYIGGFSGDVVTLCKVKPEDVIAVPDHDANKMRVCGYHILFELTDDAFSKLKKNQAFTDTEEAQLLLGRALSGDHPEPIEEVRITEGNGGGVKIIPWVNLTKAAPALGEGPLPSIVTLSPVEEVPSEDDDEFFVEDEEESDDIELCDNCQEDPAPKPEPLKAEALPDDVNGKLTAPKVDPKKIAKEVTAVKAEVESRKAKALRLYDEHKKAYGATEKLETAQALLEHKKAVKLGWSALGLSDKIGADLLLIVK